MKNTLVQKPSIKQLQSFNSSQADFLKVLSLSRSELLEQIRNAAQNNPFVFVSEDLPENFWEQQVSGISLKEELYRQLALFPEDSCSRAASYIIESLDDHGFYTEKLKDGAAVLGISETLFARGLERVQSLDPAGVAASSSMDAIALQLRRKEEWQAAWMTENCRDLLLQQNLSQIARRMKTTEEEVNRLMSQIRMCSPFPCSAYDTGPAISRLPEVILSVEDDGIRIEPAALPSVEISAKEKGMSGELRKYFQEARFFIDSINRRNQTMMIVADALISLQEEHLVSRAEKKPCTLRDLSEKTGLHVSTISRTLKDKYYEIEGQIRPFYDLFDSSTRNGTSKSAVIRAMNLLIEQEDKNQPLLDEEISVMLEEMEIYASRRTIAKYRSQCGIPGSRQRKKKSEIQK